MFAAILRFELAYQLRGAAFTAIFAIFFLLVFGAVTVDQIQIGSSEATNINSPFAAAQVITVMAVIGLFMPVVFMATGVTRDQALKTDEVFRATPAGRRTMLLGRYAGGLVTTALCFLSVPLAFLLGSLMPWLDQEQLGPFNPGQVLYLYGLFGVLNMLILGTILFTVANMTRSLIAVWVTLVAIFIGWVTGVSLAQELDARDLAALLEPYGIAAYAEQTRYWTAVERNGELPALSGVLLQNRLLWGGVALLLLAINIALPEGLRVSASRRRRAPADDPATGDAAAALHPVRLPRVAPAPLYSSNLQQLLRRVRFEAMGVMRSVAFWVVLVLSVGNTVGALLYLDNLYGTTSHPVTRLMVDAINGSFAFVPLVIAVYYTAELVWRERSLRFNEIVDATPTPSWVFVTAKFAAVIAVLVLMALVATATAVITQLARGYTVLELDQYAVRLLVDFVANFTLLTVLVLFLQVLTNSKWLGIGAILAFTVVSVVMDNVGLDHVLYNYGGGIGITYSDMNEYGPFLGISLWMLLYWGAFALVLAVLTFALWRRGSLDPIAWRLRRLPRRLSSSGGIGGLLAAGLAVFVLSGTWVFYNTNVRNAYRNAEMDRDRAEAFERIWRASQWDPQPQISAVDLAVDLYPRERRAVATVDYVLRNDTDATIEEIHVDHAWDVAVLRQEIAGASLKTRDPALAHYVFALDPPMAPGDERAMTATVEVANRGFRNADNNSPIRRNGTFFNSTLLPQIDWGVTKILTDPAERRKRGLPEDPRLPALEDTRYWHRGLLSGADWVEFRAEITTAADQIAIAPGYLVNETIADGRRTFVYAQDVPIQNFYAVQSARYAVAEDVWRAPAGLHDVALQVFYDPKHPWNVERMLEAMKISLAKFSAVFTPFQYRQMRIQEFPYARFAQSFPNTVPYSENIGFILKLDEDDADAIDAVTYVTAHEVAHQWFGHQLSAATVQGATMLIETFAQYGALLVMEDLYGREHMRRFLRYELDSYLTGRAGEPIEELPLYRVENQPYIHYRKGSLVMYLLRDQLGEDTVNRAIRRTIETWRYRSDPYPRSVDFLSILREEAGPDHDALIADLFERITLFDVAVTEAVVRERGDGRFDVTITVQAQKLYADGSGVETPAPMAMSLDVGAFTEHPREVRDGTDHILAFERREVVTGEQRFTLVLDARPTWAGVDPYNKLVDRRPEDNLGAVKAAASR